MAPDDTRSLCGRTLGEFVLGDLIGEGGYGAVYRCDQPRLDRQVVVKVLHQRVTDGDPAAARFACEARLASRLVHPFAAHVYDFGVEPDGLAWIAMEFVDGVTLSDWLRDRGRMPLEQFVPFFERVAEVVQAAHERGIVHRDLKPANMMMIDLAGRLSPKLLDFGVAKLRGDAAPGSPARRNASALDADLTPVDGVLGTAPYVAPERWRGEEAGSAADLYALAVIAFEALAGRRPYIAETEDQLADLHLGAAIPLVGGSLPPTLDAVFARALAKHPEDRYRNALEFAAALRAESDEQFAAQLRGAARLWHDRGKPAGLLWGGEVLAELERWMRRTGGSVAREPMSETDVAFVEASRDAANRAAARAARGRIRARRVGTAVAAVMALAIFGVFQGRAYYLARLAEQRAEDAQELARVAEVTAQREQGRGELLHNDMVAAQRHLGAAWDRGDHSPATAFMFARALQPNVAELARLPAAHGRMWSATWSPDGRWIVTTDDGGAQIWDGKAPYTARRALEHGDAVYQAAWAGPDRLITACRDGTVRVWDAPSGGAVRDLQLHARAPRWARVATAPARYVAAVDAAGQIAAVWDIETGQVLAEVDLGGGGWPAVAFSSDGHWVAASGGGSVRVLDTDSWHTIATVGAQVHQLAWDPTGPRLLTGGGGGDLSIWGVPSSRPRHVRASGDQIDAVAFSPHGRRIAAALRNGAELMFNAATGARVSSGNELHGKVIALEFSPDGGKLAAAASSGLVSILDVRSGLPIALFDAPQNAAWTAHFDPAGGRLATATWDGAAWVWSTGAPYQRWRAEPIAENCGLAGSAEPGGRYIAVGCVGHATRIWDTAHDTLLGELPAVVPPSSDGPVPFAVVSAAGDRAAIARGNAAEVYELPGGRLLHAVRHGAPVTALAFGLQDELVSGDAAGAVLVARGTQDVVALAAGAGIDALAVLPDDQIVTADAHGRVRVLPAGTGIDAGIRARMLRASPDGRRMLVVPSYAGRAAPPVLLDLALGTVTALPGPQVYAARWTAIGILTAHADGAARIWDTSGELVRVLPGGRGFLADAALTRDGTMVVGAGSDGTLRWWDATTGALLWTPRAPSARPIAISAAPWGILTRDAGGGMSRWVLPDPASVIGARKDADGFPFAGGMVTVPTKGVP